MNEIVAPALAARLDPIIDAAVASGAVVGTVMLVAEDGATVYARAAGFADREAALPMADSTLFRLASLTKTIVSAAALALVEDGRLGIEDRLARWIPEFQPRLADGRAPDITLRHLLTHMSGLAYGFLEEPGGPLQRAAVSDGLDQPGLSMAENLRRLAGVPLRFEPGTAWYYSLATDVLGEVVSRAGGAPLPEIVRSRVTAPLGMADTAFAVRDAGRLAVAYADANPQPARMGEVHALPFLNGVLRFAPGRVFDAGSFPSGGAGMIGTASDYLRFLEALRCGGAGILRPETASLITSDAIGDPAVPTDEPGWGFGFGAAVLLDPAAAKTPQTPGTWSWGGVYGHSWYVDPARRLTVVLLTNTAVAGMTGAFPEALRAAVYAG